MRMKIKNSGIPALMAVLIIGVVLMSGCTQKSEEKSGVIYSKEQKAETSKIDTASECLAGTWKTVVGIKYLRTGTETHTIQGKSIELCCWEVDNPTRKTKRKICGDYASSPVGYSYGILWETDKDTGEFIKSMEVYQKDGKSCQQFFDVKGNLETEHCE